MKKRGVRILAICLAVVFFDGFLFADEGMWLLNNLPLKQLKDKYSFVPTNQWVEHVQKSVVRLSSGCSASFDSADGLILTNWHCSEEAVKALSTPKNNYYEDGFYAGTFSQELKTNLNARVLISMADVTQRVNDAVVNNKNEDPAKIRHGVINYIQINKIGLSIADTINGGLFVCEVVVLYQGGQYHNYCYRVYDDIRLVFMPEQEVGFFGGDADNFEYPRYTLDASFLRAYENGKPAQTPYYFKWSKVNPKESDLLFVAGHPGRTARFLTLSALKTERDVRVPFLLDLFRRRELTTQQFMLHGKKERIIAESDLFSWQNSRKLYVGKIRGLQDPKLVEEKESFEKELLGNPSYGFVNAELAEGLKLVEEAQLTIKEIYIPFILVVRGLGFDSRLYDYAVSAASGNQNLARSVLGSRRSEPPIDLEYEEAKLRDSLTHLVEKLGAESWIVSRIMQYSNGPADLAHKLVNETLLSDISQHQNLIQDGLQAVKQSNDPMIRLANLIKIHGEY